MIITDGLKRFRRSFHAVTTQSAVHVKIDEAWREVICVEIKDLVCTRMAMLADCGDFFFINNELQAIPNAIRKNQTRIGKNHFAQCSMFSVQHSTQSKWIAFGVSKVHPLGTMNFEHDVVILSLIHISEPTRLLSIS